MNTNEERKKCTRCKVNLTLDKFTKKRDDTYQKQCIECCAKIVEKNKCPHGKRKNRCIDCDGSSICKHNKEKSRCKECGGGCICVHGKRRDQCKECGSSTFCDHGIQRYCCKECGGGGICKHNKRRDQCKDCGGSAICEHGIHRYCCKECGGLGICEHGKSKAQCKLCSDEIKVTITTMIHCSKVSDKKYDRYDADNFIDRCFVESLIEEYPYCYYDDCKVELQYVEYQNDLATIERLDNSIGHIKSNCVICCLGCNRLRKSNHN